MAYIANKSGIGRESLYRSLKGDKDPRFATVVRVLRAMCPLVNLLALGNPPEVCVAINYEGDMLLALNTWVALPCGGIGLGLQQGADVNARAHARLGHRRSSKGS